jgi:hypothetical protein
MPALNPRIVALLWLTKTLMLMAMVDYPICALQKEWPQHAAQNLLLQEHHRAYTEYDPLMLELPVSTGLQLCLQVYLLSPLCALLLLALLLAPQSRSCALLAALFSVPFFTLQLVSTHETNKQTKKQFAHAPASIDRFIQRLLG